MRTILKSNGWPLAALCLAAFLCAGCTGLGLRAKYESFKSDWDFDEGIGDVEMDQQRLGLELGTEWFGIGTLYLEGGVAYLEPDESGADLEADGYYAAVGLKSPYPEDNGLHIDYGVRVGGHYLEDDGNFNLPPPFGAVNVDSEFRGWDADGNLGLGWAFDVGGLLLMPVGGIYAKAQQGEWDIDVSGVGSDTADYDMYSAGGYLGLTLASSTVLGLDLSGYYYAGSEGLNGFLIGGGINF